jgi:hypothetical protein
MAICLQKRMLVARLLRNNFPAIQQKSGRMELANFEAKTVKGKPS